MAHQGGLVTLSASPQSLTTLLGVVDTANSYASQLTLKAARANVGDVYVGRDSTLSITVYFYRLTAGSSFTYGAFPHHPIRTGEVFLLGTAGDKVEAPY